jgi:hypothetical protein
MFFIVTDLAIVLSFIGKSHQCLQSQGISSHRRRKDEPAYLRQRRHDFYG